MATIATLTVGVRANTRAFDRGLRSASAQTAFLGITAKRASAAVFGLARAFLPLAGIAAVVQVVRGLEDLDRATRKATAGFGDIGDALRERLSDAVRETAARTATAATEIAEGLGVLEDAGLSAEASIGALPIAANFARASGESMARSTEILTGTLAALGLQSGEAATDVARLARIGDVLTRASETSRADVASLAETLSGPAGRALSEFGIGLEEGVALLSVFADANLKGSKGSKALDGALRGLVGHAVELSALGVAVFDTAGAFRPVADVVGDLDKRLEGLSAQEREGALEAAGITNNTRKYVEVLMGASDGIRTMTADLQASQGAMEATAARTMTPLEEGWARLKRLFTEGADTLFSPILDGLGRAFSGIVDGVENLQRTWRVRWDLLVVDVKIAWDVMTTAAVVAVQAVMMAGTRLVVEWEGAWQDIKAFGLAAAMALVAGWQAALEAIPAAATGIVNSVKIAFDAVGRIVENFGAAFRAAAVAVATFEDPVEAFRERLDVGAIARDIAAVGTGVEGAQGAIVGAFESIAAESGKAFSRTWAENAAGTIQDIAADVAEFAASAMGDRMDASLVAERDRLLAELGTIGEEAKKIADAALPAPAAALAGIGKPGGPPPPPAPVRPLIHSAPAALLKGSQAAFSAISAAQREARAPLPKIEAATERTAKAAEKSAATLENIKRALEAEEEVDLE